VAGGGDAEEAGVGVIHVAADCKRRSPRSMSSTAGRPHGCCRDDGRAAPFVLSARMSVSTCDGPEHVAGEVVSWAPPSSERPGQLRAGAVFASTRATSTAQIGRLRRRRIAKPFPRQDREVR
jgi:hypothetical protein